MKAYTVPTAKAVQRGVAKLPRLSHTGVSLPPLQETTQDISGHFRLGRPISTRSLRNAPGLAGCVQEPGGL